MNDRLREQACVLAIVAGAFRSDPEYWAWHRIADVVQETGSAERILAGDWTGFEPEDAERLRKDALEGGAAESIADYSDLICAVQKEGHRLVTVLDRDYPANLRTIYNRPPFLFVSGEISEADKYSIAVVGTRSASDRGIELARSLSSELARQGVTVVSGMAYGIDEAAHTASLEAGGRTIAVMGTGIRHTYPAAHRDLRAQIERHGAAVSQFWPDAPPRRSSFPLRNIVTSGISLGTVVIEAGPTSGAKNQARHALEHGKHLFLVDSLVMHEEWARQYACRPKARVVKTVEDITAVLQEVLTPPEQLSLSV